MRIEKGVPFPAHQLQKYPFPAMEVGDSFTVEWRNRHKLRQAAFYFKRRNKQFNFRTAAMNGKVRIWRVKVES